MLRFFILLVSGTLLQAQSAQLITGPVKSVDQQLREHGISIRRADLIAALTNIDPEVRVLAATKLPPTTTRSHPFHRARLFG